VGAWHKVAVSSKGGVVTATLDGKTLVGSVAVEEPLVAVEGGAHITKGAPLHTDTGNTTSGNGNGGFYVQMSLDRYIFADVDNFQLSV
jgi:hypothetical protein